MPTLHLQSLSLKLEPPKSKRIHHALRKLLKLPIHQIIDATSLDGRPEPVEAVPRLPATQIPCTPTVYPDMDYGLGFLEFPQVPVPPEELDPYATYFDDFGIFGALERVCRMSPRLSEFVPEDGIPGAGEAVAFFDSIQCVVFANTKLDIDKDIARVIVEVLEKMQNEYIELGIDKTATQILFRIQRRLCAEKHMLPRRLLLPWNDVALGRCTNQTATVVLHIGKCLKDGNVSVVAVKRYILNLDQIEPARKAIIKEVIVLGQIQHPHIVPFVGFWFTPQRLALVTEWMIHGTVVEFISRNPTEDRVKLLLEAGDGLQYLHAEGIFHGDLKGSNILVDAERCARLSDFGASGVAYALDSHQQSSLERGLGTTPWSAPEILDPEDAGIDHGYPTTMSDVYSFAMVMFELFSGNRPFSHLGIAGQIITHVKKGNRPLRPMDAVELGLTDPVWTIMEQAWQEDSATRPKLDSVMSILIETQAHRALTLVAPS